MDSPKGPEGLPPWPDSRLQLTPAAAWLTDHGGESMAMEQLVGGFCERLLEEGVPLARVTVSLPSMHPQVYTRAFRWQRGEGVTMGTRGHEVRQSTEYLNSPVAAIHQGAAAVRRRLDLPGAPMDFGILPELKAQGFTDYLALPMRFTQGPYASGPESLYRNLSFASFCTDRPGGFRPAEMSYLMDLMPLIALRLEVEAARRVTRDLLITYLGRAPAKRVLRGNFIRGRGFEVEAAIWLSDLRGFTSLSDSISSQELITILDDYFEVMARPIQDREGEVLKFMGDGLLAIFRVDAPGPNGEPPRTAACMRALAAAREAFEGLHEFNQGRAMGGEAPLRVGIGLHVGRVVFGNIGAKDRLDFTVIGRTVNEVSRVESNSKPLGRPLITSADFAHALPAGHGLKSLGLHQLRGVKEPRELFGLPPKDLPGYD